jgi:hypothetical protein
MILKLIVEGFSDYLNLLIDEGIKLFMTFLVGISEIGDTVLNLPVVTNGILLSQTIALAILAPKVAKEALTIYILRMNGDSSADDPGQLLKGTAQSVAVITSVPWIVKWMFQIGTSLSGDVAQLPGYTPQGTGTYLERVIQGLQAEATMPFFIAVAVLVMICMVVIVVMQTFIRSGELVMTAVTGSFMALGLTNRSSTSFDTWIKEMIAICVTQAAQLYMIRVAFSSLHAVTFGNPWYSILIFLALIYVAIKTPAAIKNLAHSTGVGKVLGGGAQQMATAHFMKKALMRG